MVERSFSLSTVETLRQNKELIDELFKEGACEEFIKNGCDHATMEYIQRAITKKKTKPLREEIKKKKAVKKSAARARAKAKAATSKG